MIILNMKSDYDSIPDTVLMFKLQAASFMWDEEKLPLVSGARKTTKNSCWSLINKALTVSDKLILINRLLHSVALVFH